VARAPRLYLITDRHATLGRPLPRVIAAALQGAARFRDENGKLPIAVSLREKDLSSRILLALARDLFAVTRAAGARLFINGRIDVALAVGADGVHLPGDGLSPDDVRAIAPALSVAVSTHAPAELNEAARQGADFAVFGPIFPTPSKEGLLAPVGLAGLRAAAAGPLPVLALGGVESENARACIAAGAAGIACIRAVLGAPDPTSVTAKLLGCFHDEKGGQQQ
jgi:thiamine-phosphate pyrophosphorylase